MGARTDKENPDSLPHEARLAGLGWDETLRYLDAICEIGLSVLISIVDSCMPGRHLVESRGHLKSTGEIEKGDGVGYRIYWPLDHLNGTIELPRHQFEGGALETLDGACYFTLNVSFGSWSLAISDDNLVSWPQVDTSIMLNANYPKPLSDLRSAEEIRAHFEASKDNPVIQEIVNEATRLRDRLIDAGVEPVREMSVFEVLAASSRAIWHLQDEGIIPRHSDAREHETAWVTRLAQELSPPGGA